eukprot:scaffold584259_cov42-Prasinocladus_malaysianus.AAC.1
MAFESYLTVYKTSICPPLDLCSELCHQLDKKQAQARLDKDAELESNCVAANGDLKQAKEA